MTHININHLDLLKEIFPTYKEERSYRDYFERCLELTKGLNLVDSLEYVQSAINTFLTHNNLLGTLGAYDAYLELMQGIIK